MIKFKSILMMLITSIGLTGAAVAMDSNTNVHAASTGTVYDLSEWQGKLSDNKAKSLSNEVPFVILRVQYGSGYYDRTFNHNKAKLEKYGIPYGVYSYSRYTSKASAAREARDLYHRAPNSKFYVNDFESTYLSRSTARTATLKWVQTLRPLVGNKKILFYSYQSFMKTYAKSALSSYDGYWLAAYTSYEPSVSHVLWQYTDRHYSAALNKKVDASKLRKDQSWFIGNVVNSSTKTKAKTTSKTSSQSQSSDDVVVNTSSVKKVSDSATQVIYKDDGLVSPVDTASNYRGMSLNVVNQKSINGQTYYLVNQLYTGQTLGWVSADAFSNQ